jgi:hypothetical protein
MFCFVLIWFPIDDGLILLQIIMKEIALKEKNLKGKIHQTQITLSDCYNIFQMTSLNFTS